MVDPFRHYRHVVLVDFEFRQPEGHQPEPICAVFREYRTGQTVRWWTDELGRAPQPPYPTGDDTLWVAYYSSAEWGCFLALDWPMPTRVLDLFTEFRCLTNGLPVPSGNSLLGASVYFGLDAIEAADKDAMRKLALRGHPYTEDERQALLDYCESDVVALHRLLDKMAEGIDLSRALLRGRYMAAAAKMEWTGTPIDTGTLARLRDNWDEIQSRLVREIDKDYGVFVPTDRKLDRDTTFGAEVFKMSKDWGIDPYQLADAVEVVWNQKREAETEYAEALKAARQRTGLTAKRIADWEESGRDASTWPGLDVAARELAGQYPALGIGLGFDEAVGYDDTDYSGRLWNLLREGAKPSPARHSPEVLREAVEVITSAGPLDPTGRLSFNTRRWAEYLAVNGIPWPWLESGALDLSDEAFRQMARQYPQVAPIRELRHTLSQLRLNDLAVGPDGRNRCLLSAFRARTGRNAPSNNRFIFGPSCWLRGLIRPRPGQAVAYVDYSAQEIGVAAVLSGDPQMIRAYETGDPYLWLAKVGRYAPPDAAKQTHSQIRDTFKIVYLAANYGMGSQSLAHLIGKPEVFARDLLSLHRERFSRFWEWSQAAVNHAMLRGHLYTVFGWTIRVDADVNVRSLMNFPVQANANEMLRLACCLATERGISVCAPIHDALLVEGTDRDIEIVVVETQAAMGEASRLVLNGFELRSDAKVVRWPDRYMDPRGEKMWATVQGILDGLDHPERCDDASQAGFGQNSQPVTATTFQPVTGRNTRSFYSSSFYICK